MSIQEHLNKIRNAVYGHEVRESIANGIETAYDDASENGNANMEVKFARGTHPNLRSRLEEVDNKQQQNTAQLQQVNLVADQASTIANTAAQKADVMASGSPKGVYATLALLQAAYPTGTTGAYLVGADNKWYYWSAGAWTAGGVYQGVGIGDNAIKNVHIQDNAVDSTNLTKSNINIYDASKDVAPNITDNNLILADGKLTSNDDFYLGYKLPVQENRNYIFNPVAVDISIIGGWFSSSDVFISAALCPTTGGSFTRQAPVGAAYIRLNQKKTALITSVVDIIGNPAVKTENVLDGAVTTEKVADGAITATKLGADVIDGLVSAPIYFNKDLSRKLLGDFLNKWMNNEMLNVLGIGDSILNFQNSETLSLADQKNAPCGLAGENILRKLWKILNYNVYSEDLQTIVNENGNMGFKRFDHADWVFSNGYLGTSDTMTTQDWGTSRSGAPEWWRSRPFGSYAQVLTPECTHNKPAVGTIKVGATATITIPSTAKGCSLVLMQGGTRSTNVTVKINNGTTDVVSETLDLQTLVNVTELHRDYTLTAGTLKTMTITNLNANELWIWGIEYWTDNCVRVINNGMAGSPMSVINAAYDKVVGNYTDLDLVVLEVPALNDCTTGTEQAAYTAALDFGTKLQAKGVPVLALMTHRHVTSNYQMQYDRNNLLYGTEAPQGTKIVGNKYFYPNHIKQYKSLSANFGFAVVDMFSKSVAEIGGGLANGVTAPTGWFLDGIHLGSAGITSYEEELKNLFMWDDVE